MQSAISLVIKLQSFITCETYPLKLDIFKTLLPSSLLQFRIRNLEALSNVVKWTSWYTMLWCNYMCISLVTNAVRNITAWYAGGKHFLSTLLRYWKMCDIIIVGTVCVQVGNCYLTCATNRHQLNLQHNNLGCKLLCI